MIFPKLPKSDYQMEITPCISCVEYLCRYHCSQWHTLFVVPMKEFDYSLDYKNTLFEPNDPRYRIGRGEQGCIAYSSLHR